MTPFEELEQEFHRLYLIEDTGIIKLLCATVIANRLSLDPVWLFIVAPSGGGKTELINSLNKTLGIYPVSSLTARTFISGQKRIGQETSLLFIIKEGIITFKDFTSVMALSSEERHQVMGQLREIYDGAYSKTFGTGEKINWRGKIGMIAGVTTAIYMMREVYAAMGERFIAYAPLLPERTAISRRAVENTTTIIESREKLQAAVSNYLDNIISVPNLPDKLEFLTPALKTELLDLAEFATRARSPVERNTKSPNREIIFIHPPEVPTRFSSQLFAVSISLALINSTLELNELDKQIIYKIAFDSIGLLRRQVLRELAKYKHIETGGLAVKLGYPTITTRYVLEELTALEISERVKGGFKSNHDTWFIKEKYRLLLEKYEGLRMSDITLTEEIAESGTVQESLNVEEVESYSE